MLTIRHAQMQAFAESDRLELRRETIDLLRYKYPQGLTGIPDDYLDRVVGLALATCESNGFDEQGVVVDFAEGLVKDCQHPLSAVALDARAQDVLRDLRAREAFLTFEALAASTREPPADTDGADDADSESDEEQ